MPILFLIIWTIYLIFHFNAEAMTIEERPDYGHHVEMSQQLREWICTQIDCPAHFTIEQFKLTGDKFTSIKAEVRYAF